MLSTLEIYEHLKPKLGERETRELLEWIESEKTHLATKEDIQVLKEDIQVLKEDIRNLRHWIIGFGTLIVILISVYKFFSH